jgi:Tfp pilus assembly protein PilE
MKRLIHNRRSAGWNLIEIIVAVAIGASIAAAGVAAYQGEAQKAAVAKAKDFIAQVETKKQQILTDIAAGDTNATASSPYLAGQIKVQGKALSGTATTDASTLGFSAISYGTFDQVDTSTGTVTTPGVSAWVELTNGHYIYQNTDYGTSAPPSS